jgi:hypothetical protein
VKAIAALPARTHGAAKVSDKTIVFRDGEPDEYAFIGVSGD